MKFNYSKYLLIAVLAVVFVLPGGSVHAQVPSACGVSGEGLCQSSCGPYDNIISASTSSGKGSFCAKNEQCCAPSKCGSNDLGIGECRNVTNCGGVGIIGKNTSDCVPPKLCCIAPKITEITCPGGVCTEDNTLNNSLSSICVGDFKSDFCDKYVSDCGQNPNSLMCQQTLIDLTNDPIITTCAGNPQLSGCLTACSLGSSSAECKQFLAQADTANKGLVPCTGFNCTLCSIFELIKNIIDWLVGFIFAVAAGFIVWSGMLMMFSGGDSGKVSKARETATTAVIGIAIALSGWLVIGTLLGVLTGSEKVMPWNKITCESVAPKIGAEAVKQSAACTKAGGACQNKNTALCVGTYQAGLCAGSADIQCCVSKTEPKIEVTDCSKILNGTYACRQSECPPDEMISGVCSLGQHCCPKNAPATNLNTTECSGACRSSCNSNETQVNEICTPVSRVCCKQK